LSWFALGFLLALVASSAYAIGRLHLRFAYRVGYRQGHADGAHRQFGTAVRMLEDVSRNGSAVFARQQSAGQHGGTIPRGRQPAGVARHRRED